jgi:hypothetical protein
MSLPGPYMMFVGGETGIEETLTGFNLLKRSTLTWASLDVTWLNGDDVPTDVFAVLRSDEQQEIVTLVNLGDQPAVINVPSSLSNATTTIEVAVGSSAPEVEPLRVRLGAKSAVVLRRR